MDDVLGASTQNQRVRVDVYGSGGDGAIDLDGTNTYAGLMSKSGSTYTLLRSIFCTTFNIDVGVTLEVEGHIVVCKTSAVVNGVIHADGLGSGFGAESPRGTLGGGTRNGIGTDGTDGELGGGTGGQGGSGAGGANPGDSPGANLSPGLPGSILNLPNSIAMVGFLLGRGMYGGSGGGAGGFDGINPGGAGGGSGGVVIFMAPTITGTGTIRANGSNGGAGAGNSGGGGGGGGGIVATVSNAAPSTVTLQTNAGSGGAGAGTGSSGSAANSGTIKTFVLS